MIPSRRPLAVAMALLLPAVSVAEEEVVVEDRVSDAGAFGGMTPLQRHGVVFVEESLAIRVVEPEGGSEEAAQLRFGVTADYRLRNEGRAQEVLFGVPVAWPPDVDTLDRAPEVNEGTREAEGSVWIRAGAEWYPCRVGKVWHGVLGRSFAQGWCVARLPIPAGDSTLHLAYGATLIPGPSLGPRPGPGWTLAYELFPAGAWNGPPRRVHIELDPGPHAGRVVVRRPAGAVVREGKVVWDLVSPDLEALHDLIVVRHERSGPAERTSFFREVPVGVELRASASSELSSRVGRYAAARAIDGDLRTAWCEGVPGDGVREWLQVRVASPVDAARCRLVGFEFLPGYGRTQETYRGNGRVAGFRAARCDDGTGPGSDLDVAQRGGGIKVFGDLDLDRQAIDGRPLLSNEVASARLVLDRPQEIPEATRCLRLTLSRVAPGREPDTCIGEFRPAIACDEPLPEAARPR